MGATAPEDAIRVAGYQSHAIVWYTQPFVDQLSKARFVALALRAGADNDLDHAFGFDGDFSPFTRHAGRCIDIVGNADAAAFAARRGFGAAGFEAGPVTKSQRGFHDLMVGAAIVKHTKWIAIRHRRFR